MVVTGVADQAPERIRTLVYLDAFVPQDGQSLADLLNAQARTAMLGPPGWQIAPRKTFTQPIALAGRYLGPKAFIYCSG